MARQPRRFEVQSKVNALVAGARQRIPGLKYRDGFVIGYCTPGTVDARFCDSMCGTLMYDRSHERRFGSSIAYHQHATEDGQDLLEIHRFSDDRVWGTTMLETGPRIAEARSQIVDAFISAPQVRTDGKPPEWLLMADSDMVWEADAPFRLMTSAHRVGAKIIGGLCIGGGHAGMFPTLYKLSRLESGELAPSKITEWPEGDVVKVDATGAAFLMVHRDVYMKMAKDHAFLPDGTPEPHPWFIEGRRKGNQYGEDIGFCMRAKASGFDIYVDTSVEIGHMKRFCMDLKMWRDSRP